MILCDTEIRALCEQGLVTPYDPALVNPASLDVRLGCDLLVEVAEWSTMIPVDITGTRSQNLSTYSLTNLCWLVRKKRSTYLRISQGNLLLRVPGQDQALSI
jgi:deoxycytidine triphosphate deaminase